MIFFFLLGQEVAVAMSLENDCVPRKLEGQALLSPACSQAPWRAAGTAERQTFFCLSQRIYRPNSFYLYYRVI